MPKCKRLGPSETTSRARLLKPISEPNCKTPIWMRLNKLRQSSGAVTAKAQLEAMKQARAAAQAAPVKTLTRWP